MTGSTKGDGLTNTGQVMVDFGRQTWQDESTPNYSSCQV